MIDEVVKIPLPAIPKQHPPGKGTPRIRRQRVFALPSRKGYEVKPQRLETAFARQPTSALVELALPSYFSSVGSLSGIYVQAHFRL